MHTKHCIKRKLLLPCSLSFGNNSLFLCFWDFPTPLTIFQLTYFCHPLLSDLFPSCCHFLSLWHANGTWIIAKSLSMAHLSALSPCTLTLGSSTGGQKVLNVFVVIRYLFLQYTSRAPPPCLLLCARYKTQQNYCSVRPKWILSLCLGSWTSGLSGANRCDPTVSALAWMRMDHRHRIDLRF